MIVAERVDMIAVLEADLGLTERDFAKALDVDVRTWRRWRGEAHYPQRDARDKVTALIRFRDELFADFTPASARAWLHAESPYLGHMTPADAIRAGRLDRAAAAFEALDTGVVL